LNGFIFTLSFSHKKETGSKKHMADEVLTENEEEKPTKALHSVGFLKKDDEVFRA